MKYLMMFFAVLLYLPVSGRPFDSTNRKSAVEEYTQPIYSINEFQQMADSLQLSIDELCDYPVIFPIKRPQRISSGFGMRYHPVYKRWKFHTGIDIAELKGTPVYATGNGIVTRKGYCAGYGNFIEIRHAGGFRSFYAHLSRTMVSVGDSVEIARQIACVGNTGVATGSHLHYEVRKGKRFLNPAGWCSCLFTIMKTDNKQNQYEFSKISITTGRRNKIPCADSLFPLRRTVMPAYGWQFYSLRCICPDNEMAWNNSAFSWIGFACTANLCQGRLPVCRYQSAGDTQNGYHPQAGGRTGTE